ncbi:MAG: hypothetical protein Wins2KO_30110 [Winogradskyella sp.]
MKFVILLFLSLISTPTNTTNYNSYDFGSRRTGSVYVISIGIDIYPKKSNMASLQGCVKDSEAFIQKIKKDFTTQDKHAYKIESYSLYNENATRKNIIDLFKTVIKKAKPWDKLVFTFSGHSGEDDKGNSYLIPYGSTFPAYYYKNKKVSDRFDEPFSVNQLARLMDQVSCEEQYVITEAGYGRAFSYNLLFSLFETDPLIASNTIRNRTIISPTGMAYDSYGCDKNGTRNNVFNKGILFNYMHNFTNFVDLITNFKQFEFDLMEAEIICPSGLGKYVSILKESDYTTVFQRFASKNQMRGSKGNNVQDSNKSESIKYKPKNYAFVISTNEYNSNEWSKLKNPINDADALSDILHDKYGFEVTKVYNATKIEVLKRYTEFRKMITEKDKVIFFVAGHGHFDSDLGDGYLVFKDSRDLSTDKDLAFESYLSMAQLNRMLDALPSKQVLSIFDVCYGASFELNYGDLAIENYAKATFDKGLDNFIEEKDENTSRVMLASGKYEVPDYWNNSLDHSPFADKLIKALESENEFISPGKMYSYVVGNATTPILKKFGNHQTRGDFLVKVLN